MSGLGETSVRIEDTAIRRTGFLREESVGTSAAHKGGTSCTRTSWLSRMPKALTRSERQVGTRNSCGQTRAHRYHILFVGKTLRHWFGRTMWKRVYCLRSNGERMACRHDFAVAYTMYSQQDKLVGICSRCSGDSRLNLKSRYIEVQSYCGIWCIDRACLFVWKINQRYLSSIHICVEKLYPSYKVGSSEASGSSHICGGSERG